MAEYGQSQQPGHESGAQHFPGTQQMPQQPGPVGGYPQGPPPEGPSTSTVGVVSLTILSLVAIAAVVFFLLVMFGFFDNNEPATTDTIDAPEVPAALVDGRVPALAQTVFSCPEGSMGSPTIDNAVCTVPAVDETTPALQSESTTYRCPPGASGSPSGASPLCAATVSGTIPAATVTTLVCPEGSTGSPTPASPTCTGGDQLLQVRTEPITTYECRFDTQRDDSVDPPECVLFLGRVQDVAAVELTVYSCSEGLQQNATDPSTCDSILGAMCGPVVLSKSRHVCYFDQEPIEIFGLAEQCPNGWEPRPELAERNGDNWCHQFEWACPYSGSEYVPADDHCILLAFQRATAVAGYQCPSEIIAADATVVLDRCQFSGQTEVRQPAEASTIYRCPQGSVGEGGTPDAACVVSQPGFVQALAATTYQCPGGSTGAPTARAPVCTSTSTDTVDAIVEATTVYECPFGTVGSPTEADPQCANASGAITVPAIPVTGYSCPVGSTGAPSANDPFCQLS